MATSQKAQEPSGASGPAKRLLVIDDDVELCGLVSQILHREGFEAELVYDGARGLEAALNGTWLAIVLDVMLPGLGGFEVLRRLRERKKTPVLMLTARGDHVDRIVGLEMGADDYVPKPFDPRELVARIRAVLRRTEGAGSPRSCCGSGWRSRRSSPRSRCWNRPSASAPSRCRCAPGSPSRSWPSWPRTCSRARVAAGSTSCWPASRPVPGSTCSASTAPAWK